MEMQSRRVARALLGVVQSIYPLEWPGHHWRPNLLYLKRKWWDQVLKTPWVHAQLHPDLSLAEIGRW